MLPRPGGAPHATHHGPPLAASAAAKCTIAPPALRNISPTPQPPDLARHVKKPGVQHPPAPPLTSFSVLVLERTRGQLAQWRRRRFRCPQRRSTRRAQAAGLPRAAGRVAARVNQGTRRTASASRCHRRVFKCWRVYLYIYLDTHLARRHWQPCKRCPAAGGPGIRSPLHRTRALAARSGIGSAPAGTAGRVTVCVALMP